MTWLKLDDKFPRHPKVSGLSDAAFRLHVAGMSHCAEYETDGAVLLHIAETLTRHKEQVRAAAIKELVGAGLWCPKADGWEIHDFTEWNPSKTELESKRRAAKERMNAARSQSVRANKQRTDTERVYERRENTGTGRVLGSGSDPEGSAEGGPTPTSDAGPVIAAKPETPFGLAERVWLELWQAKYRRKFLRTFGDGDKGQDRILQRMGHLAFEQSDPEGYMRHWVKTYLGATDRWALDGDHPLIWLESRLNQYGEPPPARAGASVTRLRAEPPTPPISKEENAANAQRALAALTAGIGRGIA